MYKNLILPAGILAGAIIGAGIFALPFVFANAGIITGLFYLALFCFVLIVIHLMYAEVIIKTEGEHRFPGYVKIYLGKISFWLANLTSVLGMLLTLTVYLILSASFLWLILPTSFDASDILKILFFWLLGSAAIFMEIRRLAFSEFLITIGIVLIAFLLFIFGAFNFGKIISASTLDFKNIFLPYGVILFALSGRVAIPAVINYFQKIKQPISKARQPIILGTLISAFVYLLFVFGVLGLSGAVSEDAVSGLVNNVSPFVLFLVGIFGLISIWSSYIVVGLDVKNTLRYDLNFPKILAGLVVIGTPLFLLFAGFYNFLILIGVVGGVFISLEGIFIVLMWLKARKTCLPAPEAAGLGGQVNSEEVIFKKLNPTIVYALIIIFLGGIIYQFARF